jgi:hypothetical protein
MSWEILWKPLPTQWRPEKVSADGVLVTSPPQAPVPDQALLSLFDRRMTTLQTQYLLELLITFDELMASEPTVRYALAEETLLGALLFKGVLPWQDEVTVYCRLADYHTIRRRCLASEQLEWLDVIDSPVDSPNGHATVWFQGPRQFSDWSAPWGWPYLNLYWLKDEADGQLKNIANGKRYSPDLFFPTRREPFEGRLLPCPAQSETLLRQRRPDIFQLAEPPTMNHIKSRPIHEAHREVRLPYRDLVSVYPVLGETLPRFQAPLLPPPAEDAPARRILSVPKSVPPCIARCSPGVSVRISWPRAWPCWTILSPCWTSKTRRCRMPWPMAR